MTTVLPSGQETVPANATCSDPRHRIRMQSVTHTVAVCGIRHILLSQGM